MADSEFYRPPLPDLITQIRNDILSRFQQDEVLRRTNAEVYSRATAAAVNSLYGYASTFYSRVPQCANTAQ
ncbi:hypothetical protein E0D81_14640 [Lelliottia amnigena]|uniref:Baseplate protein J-like domain-containing protein n=1 Tax=Lelliottia amnigena TaxID=61646 RepID=A0AAP2EYI9_LELAM|nr:hypothetical protein [Lelliottia amnigena]MBL5898548.1 hypothetical protein [Lelliottia amnigena]MBL5933643.1 hypothetical protein [Lelliottia amnigena]TCD17722.1 hypothetical protein E0D81_14640 [Lelliottia amnigena]